jgi:hypothetical protein
MVLDGWRSTQPVLGVFLMEKEDQWFYPEDSPLAGEPLLPEARKVIEGILETYPSLTVKKAIEITWAFGGI